MKSGSSSSSWSESSTHVVSAVSSSVSMSSSAHAGLGAGQPRGAAKVVVDTVTLEVSYTLQSSILEIKLDAFDSADPGVTRIRKLLLLEPGQQQTICVKRVRGPSPQCFTMTRIGN